MKTIHRDDVICLGVPIEVDPHDPNTIAVLEGIGQASVWAQWSNFRPDEILFSETDWLITDQAADVDQFQPAHDCENCRAGNERAREYLAENPGRYIAMGNIHYDEIWP